VRKDEVVRLHDAAARDVHQVASKHVGRQQHLARPPLKPARIQRLRVEPDLAWGELVYALAADEHIPSADADFDPGHGRVPGAAAVQLHDQVFELAELLPSRIDDRAPPQLRDHHPPLLVPAGAMCRRAARCWTAVYGLVLVAHWFAAIAVLPSPAAATAVAARSSRATLIIPPDS
jgi:hypothetical protein